MLNARQKLIVGELRSGPASRLQLHHSTAIRQVTVGAEVARLLRAGIVQEVVSSTDASNGRSRGRPQIKLAIDRESRHVIGLSLRPGCAEVGRLNLLGESVGTVERAEAKDANGLVGIAAKLLRTTVDRRTIGIGIAVPGFVDPVKRSVLFSAAFPSQREVRLDPIYRAAASVPRVLENDTHALAAGWVFTHPHAADADTLLVFIEDGQIGAALLIDGRPNRGCVGGANELGHMRLHVATSRCYCGRAGCLERIFSSETLTRLSGRQRNLVEVLAKGVGKDRPARQVMQFLADGVANAINFTRAGRVILVGELCREREFREPVIAEVERRLLPALAPRVQVQAWTNSPRARSGEMAAWLALAAIYQDGWLPDGAGAL